MQSKPQSPSSIFPFHLNEFLIISSTHLSDSSHHPIQLLHSLAAQFHSLFRLLQHLSLPLSFEAHQFYLKLFLTHFIYASSHPGLSTYLNIHILAVAHVHELINQTYLIILSSSSYNQ